MVGSDATCERTDKKGEDAMKKLLKWAVVGFAGFITLGVVATLVAKRDLDDLDKRDPEWRERVKQHEAAKQAKAADKQAKAAEAEKAMNATVSAAMQASLADSCGCDSTFSLEVTHSRLVVTVEIPEADALKARRVGTKAVLAVRNSLYGHSPVDSFRVTVNGPAPGPGLITRYGSARFTEGSAVDWEYAGPKL
jgi:hypothetical protein